MNNADEYGMTPEMHRADIVEHLWHAIKESIRSYPEIFTDIPDDFSFTLDAEELEGVIELINKRKVIEAQRSA